MLYPEIYYRVQPFVMSACDRMDKYGYGVPSQKGFDEMSARVYNDIREMYPDLRGMSANDMEEGAKEPGEIHFAQFGNRGLFGDLIDILILQELFSRRRGRF